MSPNLLDKVAVGHALPDKDLLKRFVDIDRQMPGISSTCVRLKRSAGLFYRAKNQSL